MIARTAGRRLTCALTAAAACLALPAGALAASGGAGLGSGPGANPLPPTTGIGDVPVSSAGDGLTLRTTASAMLSAGLRFAGSVPVGAGRSVVIERSGRQTGWRWRPTVTATVRAGGAFSATWDTDHIGRFAMRAVAAPAASAANRHAASRARTRHRARATSTAATRPLTVTVYRPAKATLYGPGLYGRRTACGQRLTPSLIGVANRTLRCGEKVSLYLHGRTLVVPVVDHGPYANGADWDLTMATGRALGMTGTAHIGAVSLPRHP